MLKYNRKAVIQSHYELACQELKNVPEIEKNGWIFRGILGDSTTPPVMYVFKKAEQKRFIWHNLYGLNDYIE